MQITPGDTPGWCVVWAVCRVTWGWGASQFVPNFVTGADCGLTLIIWISRASWWEVVKWSKLLSLLQSLHACNAPSWQYVRNDEVEKLRLAGVPGLTQDNVSCIMWHQTSGEWGHKHGIVSMPGSLMLRANSVSHIRGHSNPPANWATLGVSTKPSIISPLPLILLWMLRSKWPQGGRVQCPGCDNSKMTPGHQDHAQLLDGYLYLL